MTGFEGMLRDFGITAEDLNDITNHGEVIEFNSSLYQKQESSIQGIGVFAKKDIAKRCVIGIGTIDNTYNLENNDLIMVAEENILQGSEILINYRHHVNERDSWISNKA